MFTLHTTLGFNDINYLVLSKERLLKRKDINFPIEEKKKRRKFAWIYVLFAFFILFIAADFGNRIKLHYNNK